MSIERNKKGLILNSPYILFFIGFIVVILSSYLAFFKLDFFYYQGQESIIYSSFLSGIFIYICSFPSILFLYKILDKINIYFVLFILFFWFSSTLLFLFIFSFLFYLFPIFIVTVFISLYWSLCAYLRNKRKIYNIGYISELDVIDLPKIKGLTWVKIKDDLTCSVPPLDFVMLDDDLELSSNLYDFLDECKNNKIPMYYSNELFENLLGQVNIDGIKDSDIDSFYHSHGGLYKNIKRLLGIILIIVSSPVTILVMIIVAIAIRVESKGSVFFLQERIGKDGAPFTMYKFRSMCLGSEDDGAKFAGNNDMRITSVGKFIRKARFDELPQLLNILKGDMSLIGPRPEQTDFVDRFIKDIPCYGYRHAVKPGISGWAQTIQGYVYDNEGTKVKLGYDLYYIKNISFSLDLLIFFRTIKTIITGFGAR